MLFSIDEKVLQDAKYVLSITDTNIFDEFSKLAGNFLTNGINPKYFTSAASKMSVDENIIKQATEALMKILQEAAKLQANERDFHDSLLVAGFSPEQCSSLFQQFVGLEDSLREEQTKRGMQLPHYSDLKWRIDVMLSGRTLTDQLVPLVHLELSTNQYEERAKKIYQTDPSNLRHLLERLEAAEQELNTTHVQRVSKYIK